MTDRMRVAFYAAVPNPRHFDLVEFYRQDVEALEQLGHEVRLCRRPSELLRPADVYWVWWQTSGSYAVVAAALRRRPCVLVTALSDHDLTPSGMNAKPPWTRAAARLSLSLADLVLATSEDTRGGLRRYRTRRLLTAPLGVDTDRYAVGTDEADPPFALTISQLTPQNIVRKRLLDIVEVAARVRDQWPELRFRIAGAMDDELATLRAAIRRRGVEDQVEFIGCLSVPEKIRLLQSAAVYLQPTRYEAFGQAIAEAMSCGRAVVTNAVGAVPELVAQAGYVLPEGADAAALSDAVLALRDRGERRRLGQSARRRIEESFSRTRRVDAVREALETVA